MALGKTIATVSVRSSAQLHIGSYGVGKCHLANKPREGIVVRNDNDLGEQHLVAIHKISLKEVAHSYPVSYKTLQPYRSMNMTQLTDKTTRKGEFVKRHAPQTVVLGVSDRIRLKHIEEYHLRSGKIRPQDCQHLNGCEIATILLEVF